MAETRARDLADIASTATGGIEGTEVKSTGESGGAKYLREDGDGTSSWQTVVQPTAGISNGNYLTANANVADDDFLRVDGTAVEGRTAAETLSDIGAAALAGATFTGDVSLGDNNITNVGDISLDTISSDAGTSIGVTLGTDSGDDFNVGSGKFVVEGDTGNVGIGNTSPSNILHIKSADPCVWIEDTETNGPDAVADLRFAEGTGPDNWVGLGMKSLGLNFYTGNAGTTATGAGNIRMTIDSTGKVGIGTTSPSNKLEVHGIGNESAWITLNAGASNYNSGFLLKEAGTVKWFLYNDGGNDNFRVTDYNDQQGVTLGQNDTNGWGVISDDRMKRDWVNFEDALTKINSLTKVGNYRRIDPVTGEYLNDDPNKLQTGLSAQEVQSILPNSISKIRRNPEVYPDDENEYLVLHYQSVGVLAIKAIQELSAKVTALENATN